MQKFNIKNQITKLYMVTAIGYFQIAGASWVALLALRGFSLLEIGLMESIFHVVSFIFEIPSGVVADVFGRKKTLALSRFVSLISKIFMIVSTNFWTTAFAIGFSALSYNLESGTREALAYDSLKFAGKEEDYNKYASTEMVIYRIVNSTATLCAGLALILGYKIAYAIDAVIGVVALLITFALKEVCVDEKPEATRVTIRIRKVVRESARFLVTNKRARGIMIVNSFVGAVSTLVLFFLQAKLPMAGLNNGLLGLSLFIMGLGAALGARMVAHFPQSNYVKLLLISGTGVLFAFAMTFTGMPYIMIAGGFVGAFADDFLEVRTDVILNEMIPSEQRATLVSVSSFMFSVIMIVMSGFMGWIMG